MSPQIQVKVMCLIVHKGRVLVGKFNDEKTGEIFYRLLGGSLDFAETSEQGIRREIREELGCELENLVFLKAVENIFTYNQERWHQIVFLYSGDVTNLKITQQEQIHIIEPTYEFDALWVDVNGILNGKLDLYPKLDYSEYL